MHCRLARLDIRIWVKMKIAGIIVCVKTRSGICFYKAKKRFDRAFGLRREDEIAHLPAFHSLYCCWRFVQGPESRMSMGTNRGSERSRYPVRGQEILVSSSFPSALLCCIPAAIALRDRTARNRTKMASLVFFRLGLFPRTSLPS